MEAKAQLALPVIFTSFKHGQTGPEKVKSAAFVIGFSDKGKPNLVVFLDGNPTPTFAGEVNHKTQITKVEDGKVSKEVYWEHTKSVVEVIGEVKVVDIKENKDEDKDEDK